LCSAMHCRSLTWPIELPTGMIRIMKIDRALTIALLILAWSSARASDQQCEAPPYGASRDAYNVFIAEDPHFDAGESASASKHSPEAMELLAKICRMKYEGTDRTQLYRAGFTPEDIEHSSTVMLTSEYLGIMKYVAFQNGVHGKEAPKPDTPLPPPSEYQAVSVRDFAANGAKLAAQNAKVSLAGSYLLQGTQGVLYPDLQAIVTTKYHPEAGPQPNVSLSTNAASARLKRRLLSCQTDPSASLVGCTIKIQGQAGMCPLTDASGATHEAPCVNVEDGK
jgi:hypothetical protein